MKPFVDVGLPGSRGICYFFFVAFCVFNRYMSVLIKYMCILIDYMSALNR